MNFENKGKKSHLMYFCIFFELIVFALSMLEASNYLNIRTNTYTIEETLINFGPFSFMPNPGNIGDALIATSEFSLFNRLKLNYTLFNGEVPKQEFNFVYGGGGAFIEGVWKCEKDIIKILTSPYLKKGIISSQSVRGCSNMIKLCGKRFTIICRETKTYELIIKQNPEARVLLAHDMSLYTRREWYDKKAPYIENDGILNYEQKLTYDRYLKAFKTLTNVIKTKTYKSGKQTLMFFLRNDKEKIKRSKTDIKIDTFDLSKVINPNFENPVEIKIFTDLFISVLESSDIVVTDRLHVGIGTFKAGKEALLLDNSYGKISGVLDLSLNVFNNIKLLNNLDEINISRLIKFQNTKISKQFIERNFTDKKLFKSIYMYYSDYKNI